MNKFMCIFIAGLATVFLTLQVAAQQSPEMQRDTLCISSAGTGNQVTINSENMKQLNDCIDSLNVKGEIVQRGEYNSVEINAGNKSQFASRKLQAATSSQQRETNQQQATSNQKPVTRNLKPETCSMQRLTIKQSGKNNNVKIKTR